MEFGRTQCPGLDRTSPSTLLFLRKGRSGHTKTVSALLRLSPVRFPKAAVGHAQPQMRWAGVSCFVCSQVQVQLTQRLAATSIPLCVLPPSIPAFVRGARQHLKQRTKKQTNRPCISHASGLTVALRRPSGHGDVSAGPWVGLPGKQSSDSAGRHPLTCRCPPLPTQTAYLLLEMQPPSRHQEPARTSRALTS